MVKRGTGTRTGEGTQIPDKDEEQRQGNTGGDQASPPAATLAIARKGVTTGEDFARLMSALMSDVIEGTISPGVANAACNAGGKLLKVVEMQYRYGQQQPKEERSFVLIAGR